jgi:hypothetical protein
MFNNLAPNELDSVLRGNPNFKLPKDVVYYSERTLGENLPHMLETTKEQEGWLFVENNKKFYYNPHRESLLIKFYDSVLSKPYRVSLSELSFVLQGKRDLAEFPVDKEMHLADFVQELTPTTRLILLYQMLLNGADFDVEGFLERQGNKDD